MKTAKIPAFPLLVALALLWSSSLVILLLCLKANQGVFTYTLDDAYIHLAIAKNLGRHGVFGVTPYQFSASESSLLWGLILALLFRITPRALDTALEMAPLALNLIAGSALLVALWQICRRRADGFAPLNPALASFTLLAALWITPLPWLIFAGMEHTLQALLVLLFVGVGAAFAANPESARRAPVALLVLAPLVTAVRYEGVFPVAVVCLFLLLRRRFALALGVGALALLPLLVYGALSAHYTGLWLPGSVVIKSGLGDARIREDIARAPHPLWLFQLLQRPVLAVLFALQVGAIGLRVWLRRHRLAPCLWRPAQLHGIVFLVCTVANFQTFLQPTDPAICVLWFARYHAYLIVLGLVALTLQLRDLPAELERIDGGATAGQRFALGALSLLAVAATGAGRGKETIVVIPRASHNIYAQQYQMGEFVRQAYPGEVIALNDIGAVNYKADIRCFDLVGLGSPDVVQAKWRGPFTRETIDRLAQSRRARIAMVYRAWFEPQGLIPPGWRLVAQWTIDDNVICGAATVGFYAIDPSEAERLAERVVAFAPSVPRDVEQVRFSYVAARKP